MYLDTFQSQLADANYALLLGCEMRLYLPVRAVSGCFLAMRPIMLICVERVSDGFVEGREQSPLERKVPLSTQFGAAIHKCIQAMHAGANVHISESNGSNWSAQDHRSIQSQALAEEDSAMNPAWAGLRAGVTSTDHVLMDVEIEF